MLVEFDGENTDEVRELSAPMREMFQMLTEHGFDVRVPMHEDDRHLTVIDASSARCEIDVHDDKGIVWEYFPGASDDDKAEETSGVVRRVLDADNTPPAGLGTLRRTDTLKGTVAREMRARGLKADLKVYEDREEYDVVVEVVLTNPASPDRGLVRLTDDGVIRWECDSVEMLGGATVIADTTASVLVKLAREG
jgi:hypothetical protein